eukprot:scaffold175275_cov46-Prasinocladus_malaysianus.AAC.1
MVAVALEWDRTQSTAVYAICGHGEDSNDSNKKAEPPATPKASAAATPVSSPWPVSSWWAARRRRHPISEAQPANVSPSSQASDIGKAIPNRGNGSDPAARPKHIVKPFRVSAWAAEQRTRHPFPRRYLQQTLAGQPELLSGSLNGAVMAPRGPRPTFCGFFTSSWVKRQRECKPFPRLFLSNLESAEADQSDFGRTSA